MDKSLSMLALYTNGFEGITSDGCQTHESKYNYNKLVTTHQKITTYNHDTRNLGAAGDVGGPFESSKTYYRESGTGPYHLRNSFWCYHGKVYPWNTTVPDLRLGWAPSTDRSSNDSLFAAGATAIARSIPTNPVGQAAVFLGELRNDGLPSLIGSSLFKSRLKDLRKAGDEFLNVEFGWKPLVSDLRKFARGVKDSDKVLRQLSRDSGRKVRRRYTFPATSVSFTDEVVAHSHVAQEGGGALATPLYYTDGLYTDERFIKTKRWFSGCFTYHLPDYSAMNGMGRFVAEADKILGVRLTPDVLWNLAPWSWAGDWFANTGDIMHNLSAFSNDGLVMNYGYIMEHKWCESTKNVHNMLMSPSGPISVHPTVTYGCETKVRLPASPWGFGLTDLDFSDRQMAIVGALGLTRVHR